MLLGVEGGEHYGLVVGARGVEIDGGGGLGAEVAVTEVEVESADLVGAAGAGELHASLDAGDGVMSIHTSSVAFWRENGRHGGGAAKVMRMRRGGVPKWEWVPRFAQRAAEAAIPTHELWRRRQKAGSLRLRSGAGSPLCRPGAPALVPMTSVSENAPRRWLDAMATAGEDAGATFPGGCTSLRLRGGGRAGAR